MKPDKPRANRIKKQYVIVFLTALFFDVGAMSNVSKKNEKIKTGEKVRKKKIKKQKVVQKKQEITPYQLAQNISVIVNFLIKHKDDMTDVEPLLRKRRDASVDLCRAEGYCVLTMADACFPSKKGQDILALINWSNIHPFLGKDVYSDGIKKFIDLNIIYNNDSYYKASQGEVARDKLREIVHENIFSIIDVINKIRDFLPGRFYYSGHAYEGISPLDHVALYNVLSDTRKVSLSSLDVCYDKWQVALYRNLFLLLKLIAENVIEAGMGKKAVINDEDRNLLIEIARREVGDENISLPSGICAADKKLLEKTTKSKPGDDASENAIAKTEETLATII